VVPPEWAFGQFVATYNLKTFDDLKAMVKLYRETLKAPIDGFILEPSFLDNYRSLSFGN